MKNIYLTILFPCLNEELTIGKCIKEAKKNLKNKEFNYEILVVDNGSTDKSVQICKKLGARVIYENKKGYGSALITGIKNCKGKYTIMLDSDYTYSLYNIDLYLNKIKEGYDLIVGNRFTGLMEKGAMPFFNKYFGNPILSFIGKKMFPCNVNDFHCGLRIFNTEKIRNLNLKCEGMEFASEMIAKACLSNLKIGELEVKLRKTNRNRKSHLKPIRDGLKHIIILTKLKFNR